MRRVAWAMAVGAALAAAPVTAQESRHPQLDELIAKAEAADPNADPAVYHANFVAALEEARKHYPEGSPEIAEREAGVATGLAAMQKLDEASAIIERVIPVLEAAQPAFRQALMDALSLRGYIAVFKADHDVAIDTFERGLALQREANAGKPDATLARAIANLAAAYREAGRPGDALRLNTEALAMANALDPRPADGAIWYANRAVYLRELGRDDEAVAVAYEGLAYAEQALPAGHPVLANLYANLAMLQVRQGRPNAAIPLARQAFELVEKAAGAPNQNSATMRVIFATALVQAGRYEEGAAFLEQAIPVIDAQLGAESNRALQAREARARTLLALGRLDEAAALQRQVVAARDARLAAVHAGRMEGRMVLATIELARGDAAAAEAALTEGLALRVAAMPATHPDVLTERALLLLARSRAGSMAPDALTGEARTLLAALQAEADRSATGALTMAVRSAFGYLAEVLARAGDAEGAFEAQQWSARTSVDDAAIAAQIARAEAASGTAGETLGKRRQLIVERSALLAAVEAQLSDPKEDFELTAANARLAELDAAIATQEAALASAGATLPRFAAATTGTLRARLGADEMFMQVSELRDGYLVTALSPAASWQYLVPREQADIRALAARLRASLDPAA
ncbi:MAG TPA: tetratricopeptide repeat protein, partial [Croceibacterium sp.]